jgi:hypothetical protein
LVLSLGEMVERCFFFFFRNIGKIIFDLWIIWVTLNQSVCAYWCSKPTLLVPGVTPGELWRPATTGVGKRYITWHSYHCISWWLHFP